MVFEKGDEEIVLFFVRPRGDGTHDLLNANGDVAKAGAKGWIPILDAEGNLFTPTGKDGAVGFIDLLHKDTNQTRLFDTQVGLKIVTEGGRQFLWGAREEKKEIRLQDLRLVFEVSSDSPKGAAEPKHSDDHSLRGLLKKLSLEEVAAFLREGAGTSGGADVPFPADVVRSLESPQTLNSILRSRLRSGTGSLERLLTGLNVGVIAFDAKDENQGLGVEYNYVRDFELTRFEHDEEGSPSDSGFNLSIRARGILAFDDEENPNDFLDSRFSFSFFCNSGGTVRASKETQEALVDLIDEMVKIDNREELFASDAYSKFTGYVQNHLTNQLYLEVSAEGGLEANQRFTSTQLVFGARLSLDFKAWRASSNAALLNLFDYPFAFIRHYLTGYDTEFRPRGSTIPTISVGLDHVEPRRGDPRVAAGEDEDDDYWRVNGEISFRTPVARISDVIVYVNVNARVYYELAPSTTVRQADLDLFGYLQASVTSSLGLYVSYGFGRLPLDAKDDSTYSVGWQVNF